MTVAHLEISPAEIEQLRGSNYNATVLALRRIHDELAILRVVPDDGLCTFSPGQYTTLGLGYWEPRVTGAEPEEMDAVRLRKLVRRAYSFSSPIMDERGQLVRAAAGEFVEFYIVLVLDNGDVGAPSLTPRLFALDDGDRLYLGRKPTGRYTLGRIGKSETVVFAATGTGEAPHNAMVAELLARGHQGRILAVTCVRRRGDLGYLKTYRALETRFEQFQYLTLTTREPENLDSNLPNFQPKRYMQDYFASGDFESDAQLELDPNVCRVFLCGSPEMVGAPLLRANGGGSPPSPTGMVHVLQQRGFTVDGPGQPGAIHFEEYW